MTIFAGKSVGLILLVVCLWWAFDCTLGGPAVKNGTDTDTYIVQLRIAVDDDAFRKYQQIYYGATHKDVENYIRGIFIEISDIYTNISGTDLTFKFEMTDFEVLPYYEEPLTVNQDRTVRTNTVVNDFSKWLKKNKKSDYDIALLFTGFDLTNYLGNFAIGESNIGHVCQQDGVAVIELHNNPQDAPVAAHEIGHILGISHDGTASQMGGDATACDGQMGHLMNAILNIRLGKFFIFTECSAKQLRSKLEKLDKENKNCLKDGPKTAVISGPRPGTRMTVDSVCRKKFGYYSYFSRKYNKGYGDSMCGTLRCYNGGAQDNLVPTPAGLKCGKSKQCIKGKCVVTPNGDPGMSDTCPYGERVHLEREPDLSCVKIPKVGDCSKHKKECCYSCNPENPSLNMTADDACRELHGKDAVLSRASYATYIPVCKKLHCLTGMDGDKPVIRTHNKAPDGLACGGKARCNNGFCVKPFTNYGPDTPKICPYGDQPWVGDVTTTCEDAIKTKNGCEGLKRTCCKSCQSK